MRHLFTWLIILGVVAGAHTRVLATDPCEVIEKMQVHTHVGHKHEHGKPCDPTHDKQCPADHHDHGCFCHGMPLVASGESAISLQVPSRNLSRPPHDGETPPDGPFLSEDKPPLI